MIKPISRITGAFAVWVISYVFFLFSLVNNFSASHDSINYLNHIVRGEHLFHQHHLLYHFLAHEWLGILKPVFPDVSDHYIVEAFTAIWGSSTLAACYQFFRIRFSLSVFMAALGVSVIAFSYGFWFYSVNVEVYAPPLFFLLVSLFYITRKEARYHDLWKMALMHSFAILFHQVNILFGFVIIYWIYVNRKSFEPVNFFVQYALIGLFLTGGLYFIIGWIVEGHNTGPLFMDWILGYTVGHGYWQPLSWQTPLQVAAGFARAFIGAHFMFQVPAVESFLESSFRTHGLKDEIFLSEKISGVLAWVLSILTFIFSILLIALAVRFVRKFSAMKPMLNVLRPLLLCFLIYSLFFVFWMPEILEFWILQMVLVWLVLIGMLPVIRFPFHIPLKAGLFILSSCLLLVNYAGSMRWLQKAGNDWYYAEVQKIRSADPSDLVIVEDEWILKDYVRYFTKARLIATDEPGFDPAETRKEVKRVISSGRKVYLYRNHSFSADESQDWKLIQSY